MKPRNAKTQMSKILIPLCSVIMGLLAGVVLMLLTGYNPLEGYVYLFQGGLMSKARLFTTIAYSVPLVLCGLSIAFSFKTGLFNIGGSGQMLFSGLCVVMTGLSFPFSRPVMIVALVLVGMAAGMVWAVIPGILKAWFNVSEVVSGIMMNWIAYWIVFETIPVYFPGKFQKTESRMIPDELSLRSQLLSDATDGSYLNLGFIIAVIAVIFVIFVLNKTTLGYELKAVGHNRFAAENGGIHVKTSILRALAISGALCGLAGVTYYAGYATSMQVAVMPSQGFDGIAISMLAQNNPLGIVFSALFFGMLHAGKGYMNAMTAIPPEIADTITATIIYFAATSVWVQRNINRVSGWVRKKRGVKSTAACSSALPTTAEDEHA